MSLIGLHFELESLAVRGRSLFLVGWLFDERREIVDLVLEIGPDDATKHIIAAVYGIPRPELGARFPDSRHALNSGFHTYGSWPEGVPLELSLVGRLSDGSDLRIAVPSELGAAARFRADATENVVRQRLLLARRAFGLLRHGQLSVLVEKARRYLRGRPKEHILTAKDVLDLLHDGGSSRIVLVIDHDLGGGANQHREKLIAQYLADGATVVMISYHVMSLQYALDIRTGSRTRRVAIPGWQLVLDLAEAVRFWKVIYSTGVSFPDPQQIPEVLAQLKIRQTTWLNILINDYFPVCPSHFLLNARGVYCGIPAIDVCKACLAANQEGFVTLYTLRDISLWRRLWADALCLADQITVFSKSSLDLLQRAYPDLDFSHSVIDPHAIDHLALEPVTPSYTEHLRIGVVGNIGYHKGAGVVRELAQEISRRGLDTRICVIGGISAACDQSVVSETGSYRHFELPALIRETGANVFLFPSICPETFSFVFQELLEMNVPVACFDIGAPAERARTYRHGLLLHSSEPSDILEALIDFHRQIYLSDDHDSR